MTSTTFDNWVKGFVEEYLADDDPSGLPTDGEIQAMSDYLKGLTSVEQAAYACTRDIVKPQKGANIWFLIHCTAQELPETQHRLVELVKGISYLPSEMRGEIVWNHGERIKADVACDLRECLDGKWPPCHANGLSSYG